MPWKTNASHVLVENIIILALRHHWNNIKAICRVSAPECDPQAPPPCAEWLSAVQMRPCASALPPAAALRPLLPSATFAAKRRLALAAAPVRRNQFPPALRASQNPAPLVRLSLMS